MATGKKSFVLYTDLIHTVNKLPDEVAGKLFKVILSYVNDENPTTEDVMVDVVFEHIKQQLKRDLLKYEDRAERSRLNGTLGGRPKNPKEPKEPSGLNGNPTEPRKPDSDSDSDSVNVSDSVSVIKNPLVIWIEKHTPRVQQLKHPITNEEAERIIKDFDKAITKDVFEAMNNHKVLLKNYLSANQTFRIWAKKRVADTVSTSKFIPNL
jgi:hypothetical protein